MRMSTRPFSGLSKYQPALCRPSPRATEVDAPLKRSHGRPDSLSAEAIAVGLYDLYERRLFPLFLDVAMRPLGEFRGETLADASGHVLEMRRVARDGASLLFIEHGLSPEPKVEKWQHRLNPIQKVVGCGCNLNRAIDRLVEEGGFTLEKLDRFDAPDVPRTHGHLYRGIARA
jgi:hypothetical protein